MRTFDAGSLLSKIDRSGSRLKSGGLSSLHSTRAFLCALLLIFSNSFSYCKTNRAKSQEPVRSEQDSSLPAQAEKQDAAHDDLELRMHSAQTLYRAGKAYFEASNFPAALYKFMLANRKAPHASSQQAISIIHRYGLGTPENRIEALKWREMSEAIVKEGMQICDHGEVLAFTIPDRWMHFNRKTTLEIQDLSTEFTCEYTLSGNGIPDRGEYFVPDWALNKEELTQRMMIDAAFAVGDSIISGFRANRSTLVIPIGDGNYRLEREYDGTRSDNSPKTFKFVKYERRVSNDTGSETLQKLLEAQSLRSTLHLQAWLRESAENSDKLAFWLFKKEIRTDPESFLVLSQHDAHREKFLRELKVWK